MTVEYREIVTPSFPVFCLELEEALKQGFEIDANNLPHASFTFYEAVLVKENADAIKSTISDELLEQFTKQAVVFPEQVPVKRVGRGAGKTV